ncbi:MAG: hypothetical protein LBE36_08415 [Flavobacteriaceae bacterium]|jgi:RHS repeat-associated protein|nr:hypothetical protein [Flavobacteriaceae bacterium]
MNSYFSVKNFGFFSVLFSIFFSFTNPEEASKQRSSEKSKSNFKSFFQEKNNAGSDVFSFDNTNINEKKSVSISLPPFEQNLVFSGNETNIIFNSTDNHEGVIGSRDSENWNDDPADNLFNVNLIQFDKNKSYVLTYSAKGISGSSGVSRSINQSFSLGGYISDKGDFWTTITEEIDPALLKQGENQILFNAANPKDYYLVKDVSIVETENTTPFSYKITSAVTAKDKIYLKGFIRSESEIAAIEFQGKKVDFIGNEFEYFGTIDENIDDLNLKIIKQNGSFSEEKISDLQINAAAESGFFVKPEEKIISKNDFGYLLGLRNIDIPPVDASITNIGKNYFGYRFISFKGGQKTIHLPYDKDKISKGFGETDIATFSFDYAQKKWLRLKIDSIDIENEYVILTIDDNSGGETDYVNGIIKNPESPETAAFTPTSTNDVPVANPASGINMISPPTANQQGSANVSYPIEIPAGINGFQPNISINYNSDSKTGGWAGLGWDIPVETIDIDTRWGIPEFNSQKETEIYTINGEQLVFDDEYLPNKSPVLFWKDRVSGDKQFFFRTGVKEGTKIIRKGSATTNYTWEITDDDGNVKKYTDKDVIKDGKGNVVKWFLSSVTNKYGQEITYTYDDIYQIPTNTNSGKNKYLKKITYSNNTEINFINQSSTRNDVVSSYKLGVKISEFKLLDRIEVKRAGIKVREYKLEYVKGRFEKSLLAKIIQKDGNGVDFNQHTFTYSGGFEDTGSDMFWNTIPVSSDGDGLTSGNFFEANMSLISGTQGKSENWKGAVTFGIGISPPLVSMNKKGTIGVNYTYAESESFGKSQLMDMDGDGLPDKVFYKDKGAIRYRKNTGTGFSNTLTTIDGLNNIPLSKSNSYTNSIGVEASFPGIGGGLTWSDTKSNSPVYFTDVNGDGLPDVADHGMVYFNQVRLNNNNQVYNKFSAVEEDENALNDTPNTILDGVPAPITTSPGYESKLLSNIVRVWEAPTAGTINISNNILLEQNSTDGVDVWIEKGRLTRNNENNTTILQSDKISPVITLYNQGQQQSLNVNSILVEKGQRIYIIASSKENAKGDIVKVESNIQYTSVPNVTDLNIVDANGYKYFGFNHSETFLLSENKETAIGDKGTAKISWEGLSNQTFSDDIDFKIYKWTLTVSPETDTLDIDPSTIDKELIFYQRLKKGQTLDQLATDGNEVAGTDIENFGVNLNSTDNDPTITYLYFDVTADTNVAWDKIQWNPKITIEVASEETQEYSAVVQYRTFPERIKLQNLPNSERNHTIDKRRYYPAFGRCYDDFISIPVAGSDKAEVTFSMKFTNYYDEIQNKLYPVYTLKKKVTIQNGQMETPYIDYYGSATYSRVFYDIYTDNYEVGKYLADVNPTVKMLDNFCFLSDLGILLNYYSTRSQTKHYNTGITNVGNMWQGWGGFAYNGSKYSGQPLKEQEFFPTAVEEGDVSLPNCGSNPDDPNYEDCILNYINSQINNRYFTPLSVDAKNENYTSPTESAFISREYMQPYNLMVHKPSETFEGEPIIVTAKPRAIVMHSQGNSLNAYGSFLIASISGGYSKDNTNQFFQDFNGDQYPDIIVGNRYYKTNLLGALTDYTTIGDKTIRNKTVNGSIGLSVSKKINPEKNSNTLTIGFNSSGEFYSQMGSPFSAAGASLSATLGGAESRNENIWLDINGDGMMDYIQGSNVYINNGKDFVHDSNWNIGGSDTFKNGTLVLSGGGGVSLWNGSVVAGVGKNFSSSNTKVIFTDMTGDGLLDKLQKSDEHFYLYVNTGERISPNGIDIGKIGFVEGQEGEIGKNQQNSFGPNAYASLCFTFGAFFGLGPGPKFCISGGGGGDKSTNRQTVDLRDFNGDGLPDILFSETETEMTVIPNEAGGINLLESITNPLRGRIKMTYDDINPKSKTKIGNTYQMPFTKKALVKLEVSKEFPDNMDILWAKDFPGQPYETFYFEYENGVQDRRERSFLGFGIVKTIAQSPHSSLPEKGITQVTEYETNYNGSSDFYVPYNASSVRKYFYKKGLVKSTYVIDSIDENRIRQRVNYTYRYFNKTDSTYVLTDNQTEPQYKDIGRIIPFLYKTETKVIEYSGNSFHEKTQVSIVNEYDKYGNVVRYTDMGDPATTADDLKVFIAYHPVTSQNVGGIPQEHIVTNSGNTVLRKSQTDIDSKGGITSIKRFIGNDYAEYNYEYDAYGNLTKSIFPKNQGQTETDRMYYQYTFDPTHHTYITKISDARGYSSSTTYDNNYLFGLPKTITDINGATSAYTYDSFGRITQYKSPTDNDWTIKMYYYSKVLETYGIINMLRAVTERKAPTVNGVTPSLNYFSSVYTNLWGEERAAKKPIGGTAGNYMYATTYAPIKDVKGRVTMSYVNSLAGYNEGDIKETLSEFFNYDVDDMLNYDDFKDHYITYKYDELNRPVKAIQKGVLTDAGTQDLVTTTQYGFGQDKNNVTRFTKKTISPKGLISTVYTDEKGRTIATSQTGDGKILWTTYKYDVLSQLVEVTDQNGNKTQYTYDQLGRRTSEKHPDAGTTNYEYDFNNNLVSMDDEVLRGLNKKITHTYTFNRLIKTAYPDYNVTYEYGNAGAADYGAGRLIKVTDHTGIQMFKYNKLGQKVEDKRFITAPNVRSKVFVTQYTFDTFNRINKIVYPDSEEVYYNYNAFGYLENIKSKAPGTATQQPIISNILYDYNDQTKEITAGNGTKTQYTYDVWGRMNELALVKSTNQDIRRNQYTFDKDGNITNMITAVPTTNGAVTGDISIGSEKTFTYDGFNRLKQSVIKATGETNKKYYQLDMQYNDMHGIATKNSRWKTYNVGACQKPPASGDNAAYSYNDTNHPNAVSSITFNPINNFSTPWDCGTTGVTVITPLVTDYYTYDGNGNMTQIEQNIIYNPNEIPEHTIKRRLFWDFANRLKGISESGALHHYIYDAGGERTLKSEGAIRTMNTNGDPLPPATVMGAYTYYPNGYVVLNGQQLSKHYYIGANKVAARVSGIPTHGFEFTGSSELTALSVVLKTEANQLAAAAGNPPIDWGSQNAGNAGNTLETEQMCSEAVLKQVEIFKNENNQVCVDKLMNGYIIALNNGKVCEFWHAFQLDNCMINQPTEQLKYQTYWVHPDHLGSSSTITNQNGAATNWYEYMPFGEMLMEQTSGDYDNVYKYNGKELDESTGLYYYGARYYDPRTSIWLSVDPLAEKYPNVGAYVYTMNNPVMLIDPDGMDWVESKNGDITWRKNVTSENYKKKGVLKEGEIYRGTSYERIRDWNNVTLSNGTKVNNMVLEQYGTNKKMTYDEFSSASISIDGAMREGNNKLGDVTIKITATFASGAKRVMDKSYEGVAGGFGNGAPENGDYTVNNYFDRSPTGWYHEGMNKDGVGYSFHLNPLFSTGRTDLRLHPDGRSEGTEGCIGLSGSATDLKGFRDNLNWVLKYQKAVPTNINIFGNPNNNGRKTKYKSVGE